MQKNDDMYKLYTDILKEELICALGCTEPVAIAYAAAKARAVLGKIPEKIDITVSGNIIKNVKSVIVPNTDGLEGIEAAAAAGIVGGDDSRVLEVIAGMSEEKKHTLRGYLRQADFSVRPAAGDELLDIDITEYAGGDKARVRITGFHTNIVLIEKNGEKLFEAGVMAEQTLMPTDRSLMSIETILDYANSAAMEDVADLIDMQISCNTAIAEEGLANDWGANIGKVLLNTYGNDVKIRAKAWAAAGSDARMSGCEMPVVINSGSGNQGMTVSLPVIVFARELGIGHERLVRALVLANLVAIHQKTGIGRLSAYCGAVSAGCGAGAGIAYLYGGGLEEISHTIVNALAIVSGIVCDGAKPSCAAKIAAAVDAGILGYNMYKEGQQFYAGDGIVSKGVERTIKNVGRLGRDGMRETDREIIRIMTEN